MLLKKTKFINSRAEEALSADIDGVILSDEVQEDIKQNYIAIKAEVPAVLSALKDVYSSLADSGSV